MQLHINNHPLKNEADVPSKIICQEKLDGPVLSKPLGDLGGTHTPTQADPNQPSHEGN